MRGRRCKHLKKLFRRAFGLEPLRAIWEGLEVVKRSEWRRWKGAYKDLKLTGRVP